MTFRVGPDGIVEGSVTRQATTADFPKPRGLEFVWTGPYSGTWRPEELAGFGAVKRDQTGETCGIPDCYVCTGRVPERRGPG